MVEFTSEELRIIMDKRNSIRNISVIAHLGHGKSTLTESLVAAAVLVAKQSAGNDHSAGTHADAVFGNMNKSTGVTVLYERTTESLNAYEGDRDGVKYLINLIDSPGHVDFSSEVTAALRLTDGALLVVDCMAGVCVQTEMVLRQALGERIKPVLAVNKIDRLFLELQEGDQGLVGDPLPTFYSLARRGEKAYELLCSVIEDANDIMAKYHDASLGDVQFCPKKGTVVFSAGLHGWGLTLKSFAKMHAAKHKADESKFMEWIWGDNYFDTESRKWSTNYTTSSTCLRGFVYLCYIPLATVINKCMNNAKDDLWLFLSKLGVNMKADDKELTGEALMKCVMQTWLPASAPLFEMMIFHLPAPSNAQRYRVEKLYDGPPDDKYATAIRNCDPEAPLMLYVSKMIPASDKGRFFAFGRVFSGRIATGMKVRVMGPNYVPGHEKHISVESTVRTFIWMGSRNELSFADIPCGNIIMMVGLDMVNTSSATLTNVTEIDACPIRAMKFFVCPIVRVAVRCNARSDVPKLVEGLKRLQLSDHMVLWTTEGDNLFTVTGAGEHHLKFCLKDLQEKFIDSVKINISPPTASYRETVLERSYHTVKILSKNGKNSLSMVARPLDEGLLEDINSGGIDPNNDPRMRSKILPEEFDWDNDLHGIYCFGPESTGSNVILHMCRVKYPGDVKEDVFSGFQLALQHGPLAGERMRGICFEIHDVHFHEEPMYRNRKIQIIPTAEKVVCDSALAAKPRLLEPVYAIEIQAPEAALVHVYGILHQKGAHVFDKIHRQDIMLYNIKAYLPVSESFGIEEMLLAATSGKALSQCVFDHWDMMASNPLNLGSQAAIKVLEIRKLKGMPEHLPATHFERSA